MAARRRALAGVCPGTHRAATGHRIALFTLIAAAAAYGLALCACARYGLRMRPPAYHAGFAAAAAFASARHDAAYAVVAAACAVAAVTDLATGYVFDASVIPALAAALAIQIVRGHGWFAAAGCAAGGCALLLLFAVTRGRGLGLGDVKLAACAGTVLGAAGVLTALQIAFVAGGAAAALLLLSRRAEVTTALPFAPFIAAGMFLVASCSGGH